MKGKRLARLFFWGALALSLLAHLVAIIGEPVYDWLTQPEFAASEVKKTNRKLAKQKLDDLLGASKPKPVEQQVVYLQPAASLLAKPSEPAQPERQHAIAASKPVRKTQPLSASKPLGANASAVMASAVLAAGNGVASAASHVAVASKASHVAVASHPVASKPAVVASSVFKPEVVHQFPRDLQVSYRWTLLPAHMYWKINQGRYELELKGSFLNHSRIFHSEGSVGADGVRPDKFIEWRDGNPTPKYEVDFNWGSGMAEYGEANDRKHDSIKPGDQDLFSAALHLALMGNSKPRYDMTMFSGRKRYEGVSFEAKGEAKIWLGDVQVTTILMSAAWDDRRADFYLAPDWSNIPVRMTISLGKEGSFDVYAYSVTMDGNKVLEVKPPSERRRGP